MNYSEMVGRYAAKIEWSKKPYGGGLRRADRIW